MSHTLLVQPSIEQSLNDLFDIRDDTTPLDMLENPIPILATLIGSHALSGMLLSPLELIRTRIMVQTSTPYHRKYKNSFSAISQIMREEGPGAFYWSRRTFPTLLYKTLQPIFKYGSPFFISRVLNVDPEYQPLLHRVAELGMDFVELLVLMPLETVVRRLECQVVGRFVGGGVSGSEDGNGERSGAFEGMVRVNAIPYTGMMDCVSRIILEEGSTGTGAVVSGSGGGRGGGADRKGKRRSGDKNAPRKNRSKGGWFAPVSGLYRGLRMRMIVNTTVSMLRAFSSADE
ncbi:hypothetical protein HDU98_010805 [Podochytrium sp. JEL0797]|nr:hypothetical protein HDU98_010805 [Podochytrium sp. JEL0797]